MQLRADQLFTHLKSAAAQDGKDKLAAIYVLHGDEPLQRLECADAIRKAARTLGFSERIVLQVERGFSWNELIAEQQSLSLFGDKKIVELHIPTGKPGKDGASTLLDYAELARHNLDVVTLIFLPRLDSATQKAEWFATLSRIGITLRIDLVEHKQMPDWIKQRLLLQYQKADHETLQFLADRMEGNLLAAHQEIMKLGLLYPTGPLSMAQVQAAVLDVARYDVFKLNEAMLGGDPARLMRMLDGLRGEGEAEVLVLWAMSEEIRTLYKVKQGLAQGKPLMQLLRDHRVWGPRERLIEPALKRLTSHQLEDALITAAQIDRLTKGIKVPNLPASAWDAMRELGLRVALGR
ncbi:DNA polymerase III subunit delta [Ampullimonas aquatilis]|uniref:DNA polymerase III subunit delta n=1 Tax=Ampullimonas aquatilis TaxID=1341549 RepID=UPI003C76DE8B